MKNLFFALAFMLVGTIAFANNSEKTKLSIKNLEIACLQDCNEYANNAANAEVGWFEILITQGQAYIDSYNFWFGYCEGSSAGGSTVLDPVFVEKK